jgi:BCD family chlorophyll transporter-like MFS transporter
MTRAPLGWFGIIRLGLVQTSLGAIVVLMTSTLNRVMVVEFAMPAILPGALVGLHYAVQLLRPVMGHGSDVGGRLTPWIIGGMAVLAGGGSLAAVATALMATSAVAGIALAALAFTLIGLGVAAAGTSLLVLLAKRVDARRKPAAATITWIMMIAGFIVTAGTAGHYLDPFSPARLVTVASVVSALALAVSTLAVWGVEGPSSAAAASVARSPRDATPFSVALRDVLAEPQSRRFAIFVAVSMLAYSAQDLILEPFAGLVFKLTPGETTKLSGLQHGGVLAGMLCVGALGSGVGGPRFGSMRMWAVGGCVGSALALASLSAAAFVGAGWPLRASVFALGLCNGIFAVAAIGSMMGLADSGRERREGTRMGVWGAAQAIAFGAGGFIGAAAVDVARLALSAAEYAYACVFLIEALLFLVSARLAATVCAPGDARHARPAFGAQPQTAGL